MYKISIIALGLLFLAFSAIYMYIKVDFKDLLNLVGLSPAKVENVVPDTFEKEALLDSVSGNITIEANISEKFDTLDSIPNVNRVSDPSDVSDLKTKENLLNSL